MLAALEEHVTDLGDAHELPRTNTATVRALNRLYGGSAPATFQVRDAACVLRWACPAPRQEPLPCDTYRFKLGTRVGHLGLEAPALPLLLGERRCAHLPPELRYVLLADALQSLAGLLEQALRLRFEWAPAAPADALQDAAEPWSFDPQCAAFFEATLAEHRFGGWVEFEDDTALHALVTASGPAPAPAAVHGLEWLRIPLSFRLGSTSLSLREIGSIRPGDIISVLQWATAGTALRVTADLGGPAGLQLQGLAEGSHITIQHTKADPMNRDLPAPAAAADDHEAATLPLDRLDALEVALRFEVGGLSVSLGELKSIRAGHVFDLGQPLNRCPVRILAHGNVLGSGHLVAVGDRLGVRVAEFAPSGVADGR